MSSELIISILAIVLSISSLAWAIISGIRQRHSSSVAASFSLMAQAEAILKDVPSAIKFHNIREDELKNAGVTAEEFAYLLVNFTSAGVFYRMNHPNDISAFPEGSYRYVMLESPETRKTWPLLKKMINPEIGTYGKKIESTINLIEKRRESIRQ